MGELILCKKQIAANPFYLEDVSLNIYSLEELSYYIYHNVYLINQDFASLELCNWIATEYGDAKLAQKLKDAIADHNPLHVFVGIILTNCGYLTKSEIKETLEIIASFETKNPLERQKIRADRLMDNSKYVDAIYEYESMLDDEPGKKMPREFEGDIWHNLGVAYAKLYFFDEASFCFENAYTRNRKNVSMRLMLASLRCNHNDIGFEKLVDKYFIPKDVVDSIKEEVTNLSRQETIHLFDAEIDAMRNQVESEGFFADKAKKILGDWKKEYNKFSRM